MNPDSAETRIAELEGKVRQLQVTQQVVAAFLLSELERVTGMPYDAIMDMHRVYEFEQMVRVRGNLVEFSTDSENDQIILNLRRTDG